jgi:hypothetical protein
MAAALGAWLSCWRGAQAPQAEARFQEDQWQSDLPDRERRKRDKSPSRLIAMPRVRIGPALPDRTALNVEIARLRDLDLAQLRNRWHTVFGRRPPPHLPRHLLFRTLAYRLQADRFGDLDDASRRLLDGSGSPEKAGRNAVTLVRHIEDVRPGTSLSREWNGGLERVAVLAEGFAWNGKIYPSLSQVAFAITGTRWNGPRFFGLRDKPSKGSAA